MRKLLHLFCFIILAKAAIGQPTRYGNEWVDYSKTYYKMYVITDGIYRIPYTLLNAKIPNFTSVNPANLQIVHNGLPIPIYVNVNGSGQLDSTAYIEFFGKKNIGDVDSVLFFQPGYQPHPYYSDFTDTSVYFLSVSSRTNNPRFTFVNNDTLSIPSIAEDQYFMFSSHVFYTAQTGSYTGGRTYYTGADYIYKCIFDRSEAWGKGWINFSPGTPVTVPLPANSVYVAGPKASLSSWLFIKTWEPHNIVTTFNSNPLITLNFDNTQGAFDYQLINQSLSPSSLSVNNTLAFTETSFSTSIQESAVMFSELLYPRMFQFDNANTFHFSLIPGSGERYFRVNNFNDGGTQPLVYDLVNGYIIRSVDAPGVFPKRFVIPAGSGTRDLYIRDDNTSGFTTISRMDTTTFQNYTALAAQGNYMIITNKILRSDSSGHDWVEDYANYRSRTTNPSVGHLDAQIFDISQIIDQFGYGVKQSSLAIRNFVEYAYDHWTRKPEYLFLIGKSIIYYDNRGSTADYNANLVPTLGYPASDNLLACRRGSNRPLVAVGRLAARKGEDVRNYLNKMMEYEHLQFTYGDPHQNKEEKLWMKQIMHMSGGADAGEQTEFAFFLSQYQNTAQDTSWGSNVFTFYKTTSNPIDNSQAQLIRNHIDSGVSLITFFGHAAAGAFDISVDNPETWTNYTKYPMIYSNGCLAGSISDPTQPGVAASFSERFVLTPGQAAIGFTGTSDLSVANSLFDYGSFNYYNFCAKYYTKPWGKAMQYAQWDMDSLHSNDDFEMAVSYENTLHGDPALTLNQYSLPDYQIDQSSVYFTPSVINASLDSFVVNVACANLGKAIKDSMQISVTRSYPDPSNPANTLSKVYTFKVNSPHYLDTFSFRIPTFPAQNQGYGQNQFSVFVESGQRIAEISETNNGQGIQYGLSIASDDIIPIYPYEFAIVPKQNITVKASTADPFAKLQTYHLQVDTSALFRHPLAQTTVRQVGGIIHWALPITFHDSTVYYWRVSRDSISDSIGYNWHVSSFVYIKNEYPGWNQSHFFQYQRDNYDNNVYLDSRDRTFKFVPTTHDIQVNTGYCTSVGTGGAPGFTASNLGWIYDGSAEYVYRMGNCGGGVGYAYPVTTGGFTFAVLDTFGNIWQSYNYNGPSPYGQYGNYHCYLPGTTAPVQAGFDFSIAGNHGIDIQDTSYSNKPWSRVISRFLDSIPNGYIIVMYAVSIPPYRTLGANDTALVYKLARMGASELVNLCIDTGVAMHNSSPYIFWTMKGNPSWGGQAIGGNASNSALNYTQVLHAEFSYGVLWNQGSYSTPTIGPSTQWGSFHWRWRPESYPQADTQSVSIIGVQANGAQATLLTTKVLDTTLNFINARIYPNIYLKMNVKNNIAHIPSQLYYWRVLYKTVPEAAINPAAHFLVQRDTIGIGDSLNVEVALENVTDISMDSMRTQYTMRSLQNGYQQGVIVKQDSLRANDTLILKFKQQILNPSFSGKDQLTIEANPEDALHQPEQFHFNNYAVVNYSTTGDQINPLLDVTFDSRRIMNGDIVSAKPDIVITVKDENKYLGLVDTSVAQIYVRYPGQTIPTLINYDNNILTFYPATGNIAKRNEARIEFKPTFTIDGSYDLLIRDKDASGNYSSSTNNRYEGTSYNGAYYDYKITFNVITKSMITNVLTYPNPFSTRTQFVFTLTGSQVPDYMKIQIMTVTGHVVKEITKDQLGPIHIGTNITDYYWDGRDQYGDKLANGVYFYRVIADLNNKQLDHMSSSDYGQFFDNTNIDKYFKNGFGKLVIMR